MSEHVVFNDLVRRAAGHEVTATSRAEPAAPKSGDIGIGRGGAAAARPKLATGNALVNDRIRKGARIVRDVSLQDGLSIDLDDPWS
jgi:hypothetical protein